ncbi:alpha-L-arabinofuranosidase [Solidesulfovibrio sp.]|uniref:alpha-L-arabinofuranosidase n=1 Tax=Solidesulfovibrio sp. TaxID=2910990 RepID=UPI002B20C107|nr:alpha-L-arabinofuranosidase [Solidesulfovibrio sp.]MEA5087777.1 alpha-L-arabinofuranosidase [Solidesulfovibrio sp.]
MSRFSFAALLLSLLLALPCAARAGDDAATVVVDAGKTLRRTSRELLGINVNYFMDADGNRRPGARRLARAVLDLGVGTLRYPGGEKSDGMFWAAPPFRKPGPALARQGPDEWPSNDARVYDLKRKRFAHTPLDIDAFIRLCRRTGAEPVIVVAYDSMYKPGAPGETVPDMTELLENAVSLVRYANIERRYGIKYWEIGNESYFYVYNGGARAADYARDFQVFAAAMKGVDPSIKVGANGPSGADDVGALDNLNGDKTSWWREVFGKAAGSIDFVSVHEYPCYAWYGYDYYRENPVRMLGVSEIDKAARRYGPAGFADRLRYLLTEVNSADWYAHPQNLGWKHENTLGHALVLFDMLGQAVSDPRVVTVQIWATRWLHNDDKPELWDALDGKNEPLPTGMAVKLLARGLGDRVVAASDAPGVRTVAACDDRNKRLTVYLINKDAARDVDVRITGETAGASAAHEVYSGKGADDHKPRLAREASVPLREGQARLRLPAESLTILTVPVSGNGARFARKKAWTVKPRSLG